MATKQRRHANVRRRAVNPIEPPAHLAKPTREWWASIAPSLEDHQLRILTCAAENWDMKETARQTLVKSGLSYTDDKGQIRPRPEAAIARNCHTTFLRAVAQLRLDVQPPKDKNGYGIGIPWHHLDDDDDAINDA